MVNNIIDISFYSDEFLLKGHLHLPEKEKPTVIIGCHGLASDGDSPKQIALAEACNKIGLGYFRFSHRGCGLSEGEFLKVTNQKARCNDLRSAVDSILKRSDTGDTIGLFGSSMGGTTCLAMAVEFQSLATIIIAAPVDSSTLSREPDKYKDYQVLPKAFYEKNLTFNISEDINSINNLLIFHGDTDEIVPFVNAEMAYSRANDPKKLIVQKNGDHRMSDEMHQKEFIQESVKWYKNYIVEL